MQRDFAALSQTTFDVLVIGGGATGAAIALDATLRGLRVALIEKNDFSGATSAASSKLMHGGLRYLANGEVALVREGLRERRVWQRIAKHLVRPLPFLLPTYTARMKSKTIMRLGLLAYDLLAFGRNIGMDAMQRMPSYRSLNVAQTLGLMPHLNREDMTGGMIYHDAQMLSPERLCLAMLRTAYEAGTQAVNYTQATGFITQDGRVTGVKACDKLSDEETIIQAHCVINAAGPWADMVMQDAMQAPPPKKLVRSKGIHFLTRDVTHGTALAIPIGDEHLFVLPWQGKSLFATTDTKFDASPDEVHPDPSDLDALLEKANAALPGLKLQRKDIDYAYAGLRPLVADPATPDNATYGLSRGSEIVDHASEGGPAGLISALGGKWTTSRRLGEEVVDLAVTYLGHKGAQCRTRDTLLACTPRQSLADFMDQMRADYPHVPVEEMDRLSRLYGRLLPQLMAQNTSGLGKLRNPLLAARVSFALEHEMACKLEDVVLRRLIEGQTGAITGSQIRCIADYMAARLQWSEPEKTQQLEQLDACLNTQSVSPAKIG
ncbi:glycerol-3-phosphate dehydrogenase/oxidase [Alphaproteobacteria bacterium]|nr:glycerol-3-phosphate dehydrogenase/oxidase [Alphaproteobacteria bacterium]